MELNAIVLGKKMNISFDKLRDLIKEAIERGYSGCQELKEQEIDELLQKFGVTDCDLYKIWRTEELKKMSEGTIFTHIVRGRCWVMRRASGQKYMQFLEGQAIDFNSNDDPWDKPMKIIHNV